MGVYLAAGVSGAHLNPAVSIALWLFRTFERNKVPAYILSQTAGAFCAAALVYGLHSSLSFDFEQAQQMTRGTLASLELASVFSTDPHASLSVSQAFLVEVVITAILLGMRRDIPYFLVPLIAPVLGACIGAAGYKALICKHLPGLGGGACDVSANAQAKPDSKAFTKHDVTAQEAR